MLINGELLCLQYICSMAVEEKNNNNLENAQVKRALIDIEKVLENKSPTLRRLLPGFVIRYLKRICGHLRNIATSIVNPFHRIGFREKNQENK